MPEPAPSSSNPRPKPKKTPATSSDVVMETNDLLLEPSRSLGKGKSRSDDVGTVSATRSKSKQKRGFQDSPTKVHLDAKRVRKGDVDLAELVVDEDSLVDPQLVPGVVGKVSSWAMFLVHVCGLTCVGLRFLCSEDEEGEGR